MSESAAPVVESDPTPGEGVRWFRETAPAAGNGARWFSETGHAVSDAFLAFLAHYGLGVCGYPISDVVVEGGVRTQYFQHLALEETVSGAVRLKPLGEAWLALQQVRAPVGAAGVPTPEMVDLVGRLPRHATRTYATRSLADIRYVVVHHTGLARP